MNKKHFTRRFKDKKPQSLETWITAPKELPTTIPQFYIDDAYKHNQTPVLKWHWLYGWGVIYCPVAIQDSTLIFYPLSDAVRHYVAGHGYVVNKREAPGKPYYVIVKTNHVVANPDEPPKGEPGADLAYVALNPGVIISIF